MARGMTSDGTTPLGDANAWEKIFSARTDGGPVREFTIESIDESVENVQCLVIPCTFTGAYDTAPTPTSPSGSEIVFPLKPGAKQSFIGVVNGVGSITEVWVRSADAEIRYAVTAA